MAGVLAGEKAFLDFLNVRECEEAALRAARNIFEAARLEPPVFECIVGDLAAKQAIDLCQGEHSRRGKCARHDMREVFAILVSQMGVQAVSTHCVGRRRSWMRNKRRRPETAGGAEKPETKFIVFI